jgi:hypothetical protein
MPDPSSSSLTHFDLMSKIILERGKSQVSFVMTRHRDESHAMQQYTYGRPFGISSSVAISSGILHKCISRPRIAFSLLEIRTRFP